MGKIKKCVSLLCAASLVIGMFFCNPADAAAAKKVKLSKKKVTVTVGGTYKLNLKNGVKKAKVTWKSGNKKIVKIIKKSAKGKKAYAKIKGLKTGKANINAVYKVGKKKQKLTCRVTVKKNKKKTQTPVIPPVNTDSGNVNTDQNTNPTTGPNPVETPTVIPDNPQDGPITIYSENKTAPIIMDAGYNASDSNKYADRSYRQIMRAVMDLRQDIAMVTGAIDYREIQAMFDDNSDAQEERLKAADSSKVPEFITDTSNVNTDLAIIVGTIDDSRIIKNLMESGRLEEAKSLKGVWEGYVIKQVKNPIKGVENALVIAGSDARGAIYGVYTVSESIGVSPFYWYSDVPVEVKSEIKFDAVTAIVNDGPDVKYRGIFINDEEKSNEWAEKKFAEDGKNGPGVNYYRKVFELMLRMKSNTLWPAMHGCSVAFNKVVDEDGTPVNAKEAAEYGIIMSASHCEILLRNNVGEWSDWFNKNKGNFTDVKYADNSGKAYDFTLNREMLLAYWRERLMANKDFESIFTVGIRGPHDEAFNCENLSMYEGSNDSQRKVEMMKDVISCQRELIAEVYGEENVQKMPQALIPYKEMNDVYNAGLNEFMMWDGSEDYNGDGVIDWRDDNTDVMLMWAEDNENYLRQDLTDEEAARKGGAGIYYHISYWGPPSSYLWLNSTSLYVMSEQMHRGYNMGADDYWILNVGDIKPSEPSMEFFLKMAWDSSYWNDTTVREYLKKQAARDYGLGDEDAAAMADAVSEYYEINGTRKAEFYAKADFGNAPKAFSATANGDEAMLWIERSNRVVGVMEKLYNKMPEQYRDAFYEQFYYNMLSVNDIIENFGYYEKNRVAAAQGRIGSANVYAKLSKDAAERVRQRKNEFNATHDNKWTGFMDYNHPGRGYQLVGDGGEKYAEVSDAESGVGAACENSSESGKGTLRFNSLITDEAHYFDVFDKNAVAEKWVAEASKDWIKLSKTSGETRTEQRVIVTVDWTKATGSESGTISVYNAGADGKKTGDAVAAFTVEADKNTVEYGDNKGYIEADGYVAIEAEHFSEMIKGSDESYWGVIKSNGQMSDTMKALPDTAKNTTDWNHSAKLKYRVYFRNAGTYTLTMKRLPVLNEGKENGVDRSMNAAVGVGTANPAVLKGSRSGNWDNTLNMCETLKCNITVNKGWNDIIVYRSDASFVFDKMVVETVKGAVAQSVLGLNESPNNIAPAPVTKIGKLAAELESYNPAPAIVMDSFNNVGVNQGESKTVDFSVYATNGEDVAVTAKSSNETDVSVSVEGKKLIIKAGDKSCNATITVTAAAKGCEQVIKEFRVTVRDSSAGGLYLEESGEVVMNAADALLECAYSWTEVTAPNVWEATDDDLGVKVLPDVNKQWSNTNDLSEAPSISFKIKIATKGTYYLFTNMSNPNDNADSYHVLVDGTYRYTHNNGNMAGNMIWRSAGNGVELSVGEHTITIAAREDGLTINQLCLTTDKNKSMKDGVLEVPSAKESGTGTVTKPTAPPVIEPTAEPTAKPTNAPGKYGAYLEDGGKLVINAADALEYTRYASFEGASDKVHSWEAAGKGIQVTPDTGKNWTTGSWDSLNGIAPALRYKIHITTPGDYYLFVNMSNPNNAADSYFVAVDGVYKYIGSTGEQIKPETWYSEKKAVNLTEGEHELIIFAREDGLLINQLLLSNNKDISLTGFQTVSKREEL
ncbi:MAG: hypothetical protein HFH14_01100 [Lachnospiraceae bacterium]|nr:hypothetical protein [Lachnospiraceae bacterium]